MSDSIATIKKDILGASSCSVNRDLLDYTEVCRSTPTCHVSDMFKCVDDVFDGVTDPPTCRSVLILLLIQHADQQNKRLIWTRNRMVCKCRAVILSCKLVFMCHNLFFDK